jgi:ABC-2 type transport system permease protein
MNWNVLFAVFKRNFVSYFANPIGYVFLCVFVLLSSFAAFWPDEFFNNNLANLDQLNHWFPLIMLIFIPAVTMSIWAQERQQGTDELLLTIPGGDLEVVLGKYLAALSIFTVSLVFSLLCNFARLASLGEPDGGLFLGTYMGYWLIGLAMLGIGMVASFLTKNLTISFILAALFCAPLVLLTYADTIFPMDFALQVKHWSIGQQLYDFGRGVISLSGITYFCAILAVSMYLSTVLLGRRHWGTEHLQLPSWITYPLVVLTWMLIILAVGGAVLLFYTVLVIFLDYLNGAPIDNTIRFIIFGSLGALWIVMGLFILVFSFRQGWSWFPSRIPWMVFHYAGRVLALLVIAVGINAIFERYDLYADVTSEQVNSLSRPARQLLTGIKFNHPVHIEAFISPEVPESFVQTRLNLLSTLRELQRFGGSSVEVRINDTNRYSEEATLADARYGIRPRPVSAVTRGVQSVKHIFMGVALTSGLQKVIVPFINKGTPLEYEMVRSLATLAEKTGKDEPAGGDASDKPAGSEIKRKVVGIIPTDAPLYGRTNWPLIAELEKQYEVKQVDMSKPITKKEFDVLLAVQPSTLAPEQMDKFVEAVGNGMPTAIFEDPFPVWSDVPPTSKPRRPPQGMEMYMRGPLPKGDLQKLWDLLHMTFNSDQIVWQEYNPYPKISEFSRQKEFVFLDAASKADFSKKDPVSSGLQQLFFPFSGWIQGDNLTPFTFQPLVSTGRLNNGTIRYRDLVKEELSLFGSREVLNDNRPHIPRNREYVMAARIQGMEQKSDASKVQSVVNAIVVADCDMLSPIIFNVREQGEIAELGITFDFDNVTFVLNVLDSLAGDDRFVEIRSHRPKHRTLARIEQTTAEAKEKAAKERENYIKEYDDIVKAEKANLQKKVAEIKSRKDYDPLDVPEELRMTLEEGDRRLEEKDAQARQTKEQKIEEIDTALTTQVNQVRRMIKTWAVLMPPIPPLVVAVVVFFTRRAREREGIDPSRLR